MADRELRRMHRAELIEIIYALKQNEDQLKAQNAALTAQLQDRQLRLESAGSIAQAALELNNVFAAAQAAADDYLHSVQASLADTNATAANTLSQARSEAKRILEQAQAGDTIITLEVSRLARISNSLALPSISSFVVFVSSKLCLSCVTMLTELSVFCISLLQAHREIKTTNAKIDANTFRIFFPP